MNYLHPHLHHHQNITQIVLLYTLSSHFFYFCLWPYFFASVFWAYFSLHFVPISNFAFLLFIFFIHFWKPIIFVYFLFLFLFTIFIFLNLLLLRNKTHPFREAYVHVFISSQQYRSLHLVLLAHHRHRILFKNLGFCLDVFQGRIQQHYDRGLLNKQNLT